MDKQVEEQQRIVVIMPTYGCRAWLLRAINSIRFQTQPSINLYVADDAGDDVDEDLMIQFPEITFLKLRKQSGPYNIANLVISLTDSEFVGFQDADDWSSPQRFKSQVAFLHESEFEGCGSWFMLIDMNGEPIGFETCPENASFTLQHSSNGNPILHPSTLYYRRVFDRLGCFDNTTNFGADSEFFLRACFTVKLGNVQKFLYYQMVRPNSLTQSKDTSFASPKRIAYTQQIVEAAQQIREGLASPPAHGRLLAGGEVRAPDIELIEWIRPGRGNNTLRGHFD